MRKMQKSDISIIAVLAFTLVSDRLSKWAVAAGMELGESFPVIPHILNFTYVHNRGASFGILADKRWVYMLLSVVALVVMTAVLVKYRRRHMLLSVSLSMIIGGGLGNMIDRLFVTDAAGNNVVIDFLEFDFVSFAVFNLADTFITVGAVLLAVYVLFFESKVEKRLAQSASADTEGDGDDKNGG